MKTSLALNEQSKLNAIDTMYPIIFRNNKIYYDKAFSKWHNGINPITMKTFHFAHSREERKRNKTSVTGLVKQNFYFHTRFTVKTIRAGFIESSDGGNFHNTFRERRKRCVGKRHFRLGEMKIGSQREVREIRTTGVTTRFQILTISSAPREGRQIRLHRAALLL